MTLADAIRKGAMRREQARYRTLSEEGQTCAMGAAYEGVFGAPKSDGEVVYGQLNELYRLYDRRHQCPARCGYATDECGVIIHLNDQEQWSREQIADWLDTL